MDHMEESTPTKQLNLVFRSYLIVTILIIASLLSFGIYQLVSRGYGKSAVLWLTFIFVLYLSNIFIFAYKYFQTYKAKPSSFSFNSEISVTRVELLRRNAEFNIERLEPLIGALNEFRVRREQLLADNPNYDIEGNTCRHPKGVSTDNYEFVYSTPALAQRSRAFSNMVNLHVHDKEEKCLHVVPGLFGAPTPEECIQDVKEALTEAEATLQSLAEVNPKIWSYSDFLYFSTITQTTVGYGDILPNSAEIRRLVTYQILIGIIIGVIVINTVLLNIS